MWNQLASSAVKNPEWVPILVIIATVSAILLKIDYVDLIQNRLKRKLDNLREAVSDMGEEHHISKDMAKSEIVRLRRSELYGVDNYQYQNEVEKIINFHFPNISDSKFLAVISPYLKWKSSRICFSNTQIWVLRIIANGMVIGAVFLLTVSILLIEDGKITFPVVFYSSMAVCYALLGTTGMPPSNSKVKKAQKYISDYYNSIDTD